MLAKTQIANVQFSFKRGTQAMEKSNRIEIYSNLLKVNEILLASEQ